MNGTQAVIQVRNLSKSYGKTRAVDGISMEVFQGEIFGVIGANGAGKTTTLEMIMGLRDPDGGTIEVLGLDVMKNPSELKHRIGIQLQETALYDRIKVREALELFGSYYRKNRDREEVIEMMGLKPYLNQYVKKLSGGWQQRTALALAMINDPEVIFLDEPTTGLDPQARNELWEIILKLKEEGKTIILSTHYMEEARRYCHRVAVIRQGRIVACDTPEALIARLPEGKETMDDVYVELAVESKGETA
ncbi:ABC transporter ATP-binding protein [Kroppenstedtia eburnea]|uniref:ABC-2 type transport system ATP-binding protein n=1 Tax=Kroppenstedtia eburnea TaxID=714067 RepID=A0A1N7LNI1_9BACL|nr:ABC transporter ATP-binding protein [Kroppenstedtia eburnea]QKI81237.1 ABC transporter ATP-binding protein [Kroppenstedtia eburnea]SIS75380.1 ABC-2 type transport system ATP-binding protein [Kroppenstedtia eburnea]